jgi:hypothetical protein
MDFVSHAESQVLQSEEDEQKWKHHHKMWENWSSQLNARYAHSILHVYFFVLFELDADF